MTTGAETRDPGDRNVADYKVILRRVLDNRPSGTRLKLAAALGKNRSFVTQITNPAYLVPIPAKHVAIIFEVCHLSGAERTAFLEAYGAVAFGTGVPSLLGCSSHYTLRDQASGFPIPIHIFAAQQFG